MPFDFSMQFGEGYDRISILEVKILKVAEESKNSFILEKKELEKQIITSIGIDKHLEILGSVEYVQLLKHNLRIFELIDEIKVRKFDAQLIDNENFMRFKAKKNLQETFFKDKLIEQKIGYIEK